MGLELSFGFQQAIFIMSSISLRGSVPTCSIKYTQERCADVLQTNLFGIIVPGKMETIRCLKPSGSFLQVAHSHSGKHTHACMHARTLRLGEKEQKGSTPGWSHPLQITICTRHLRTELSSWRENKQTEYGRELGK